jgi:hypothetical protein
MNAPEPFRRTGKDLVPFPLKLEEGNSFKRLMTASVLAKIKKTTPLAEAARLWPSDDFVQRAASAPAMTGTAGWASDLAHKVIKDALEGMGPAAAGAQLLLKSLVLAWDGNAQISAPGFVAGAGNAGFVQEGSPIPVRQLTSTAALLQPFKLAALGVLSRTMIDSSNAEQLVGDVLMRSASAALDVGLFSMSAATASTPAGIRYNVAALTASAVVDTFGAIPEDISNLVNAVTPVGGGGPFVLIGSPGRIAGMVTRFAMVEGAANIYFASSPAVGNDLLCVAPNAIVCALSPVPDVGASVVGELHMSDTPQAITNGGVATPARSLFQTDSIGLKMRWPVSWAVRDSRAVAWVTPAWK